VFVTTVNPAKAAELIEMPWGQTLIGPKNHLLDIRCGCHLTNTVEQSMGIDVGCHYR